MVVLVDVRLDEMNQCQEEGEADDVGQHGMKLTDSDWL